MWTRDRRIASLTRLGHAASQDHIVPQFRINLEYFRESVGVR